MDSGPGRCWVCDGPGKLWCSSCRFALYCSLACQKKDKVRHMDECFNSSRRRVHCNYCGREEALGGVPCTECLVCCYCTDSCKKMDSRSHRPVCQNAKEKVLEAAKKIGDWNRRAKGIPQYMGRLIHAVDYLRWADNEGVKTLTLSKEANYKRKPEEEEPGGKREGWRLGGRRSVHEEISSPQMGEEETLRMLLLGADLKHVLRTLHDTPDSCTQGIDITLLDSSPHILARNVLMLYLLMLPDAPTPLQDQAMLKSHAEKVVMVFYSLSLDMETHALLCNTLHNLLNMTYKSFLHEMRQQVYIDAVSYTMVQAIWSGWMSFANDPSAMQKLEKVRTLKMSGKVVKEVLSRYVKSCPKDSQKAIMDWIKRGSMKKQKGGHFPNVTLTCFSPLKKEYLDRFEDVNPKWSEETEWIRVISPEEDMIYAPHGIDMIFQDWDFVLVSKNTKKENNVIEMYLKFLTQVFKKASQKLLKSNQISISFIRANVRDVRKLPMLLRGKFDRIGTGIHADLLGTPFVLQELGYFLNTDNSYARLLTHHRVWSLCLNWQHDQQAREMYQKSVKNNKPPDPNMMLSARWSTFRHFLQAELLHHLHLVDGRPVELENVLPFREVSHAYDMILSDYTHHLNRIVPFRFRPEKRMVSMVDSRLHTLEWRRVGRTRRSSAPAAAQPKILPDVQNSDVDPASRYVDNLITFSKTSPAPSPTNSDSCPSSWLCSRESSLSPCPPDYPSSKDDRVSRSRQANRPRPRSLYVSARCKSPLLSSEFDFWEQQNLVKEKKGKTKTIRCSEIPEGIKNRAQLSLEAEVMQSQVKAKSAPASPQAKCKPRMVKEKASVFERGSTSRATFPETRKHIDTITPSTPVKKLVMMFSKAFAAKEKDTEIGRPLKRSNSFHGRRASYEQGDEPGTLSKSYTYSSKTNKDKSKNAVESGMCTLPRKSRPHTIAVSKFSYLEGCIDKKIEAINNAAKEAQEREKKKREMKKPTSLNIPENQCNRKSHVSPIRSLIAGLNTLSVSPVMPRAAKQHKKTLKDTISIKRDELRLINLRPGSPRLPSPVSSSPTFDGIQAIDWPETQMQLKLDKSSRKNATENLRRTPTDSPRKTPTDSPRKTPTDSPRKAPTDSPRKTPTDSPRVTPAGSPLASRSTMPRKSPSPSPSSSIPKMFNNFRRSLKKIPQEPEYVAPPLYTSKSPTIMLHSPSSDSLNRHLYHAEPQYDEYADATSPPYHDEYKLDKLEDIFSPKPSPTHSQNNLYQEERESRSPVNKQNSGLRVQTIRPDIENNDSTSDEDDFVVNLPKSGVHKTHAVTQSQRETMQLKGSEEDSLKIEDKISPEDLMVMTSVSLSVSLTEADQEVSELFSHGDSFTPIKVRSPEYEDDKFTFQADEEAVSSENDYIVKEKPNECTSPALKADPRIDTKAFLDKQHINSPTGVASSVPENEQIQADTQYSSESTSPQIVEQCPTPVYKIVERFAQRIQAEQQLIERPASPKNYNVMKRNSWTKTMEESFVQSKDKDGKDEKGEFKYNSKLPTETESPSTPNRIKSPEMRTISIEVEDDANSATNRLLRGNSLKQIPRDDMLKQLPRDDPLKQLPRDNPHMQLPSDKPLNQLPRDNTLKQLRVDPLKQLPRDEPLKQLPSNEPLNQLPRDNTRKQLPRDDPLKQLPRDDPLKQLPRDNTLKQLPRDDPLKQLLRDDSLKQLPRDDPLKQLPRDDPLKQLPRDDPLKQLPRDEPLKQLPRDDPLKQLPKDEVPLKIKIGTHKEDATERNAKMKGSEFGEFLDTNTHDSSSPRHSASLRSTPVAELTSTPVNKMVEKFALEIQAQSLPTSPRASRPQSIGTLIQEDFLRLYSENPTVDEYKPEDDAQENVSLKSDCCEETMFDISDDEEQKTGDIGIEDEKNLVSKSEPVCNRKSTGENSGSINTSQKAEKKGEEKVCDVISPSPLPSNEIKPKQETKLERHEKTLKMSRTDCPSPRESRCDELRHEFLQKIRGLTDSPIPPSKKKYGEIKATLSKKKNDILQGEKMFADDINNLRACTSSPRLEDMAIVSYTIKIDTESITEQLRTPPVTPRDEPGGAIGLLADKENQGLDGDSQELCSNEYKKAGEMLTKANSRNSSPVQHSPMLNTFPRKSKSNHVDSPTTSLKRPVGKKKLVDTDISQHKVQLLKSSRTGGMDKMSFRQFVKASIASEDSNPIQPDTIIVENDSQVIEYTSSSVDVSAEEFDSNPEDVEEAIEAISLTSEEDEPPKLPRKKLILYKDDGPASDNSESRLKQSPRRKSPSAVVRRKRLPSSRSPSDLRRTSSPRGDPRYDTDDSDEANEGIESLKRSKGSRKITAESKKSRQLESLRLSPLGISYSDDARQSPDSVGLNFKVEIPDAPLDSNRDIRRFMWGSLRRKKNTISKSNREDEHAEEQQGGSEDASTKLPSSKIKGSIPKLFLDKKKTLSDDDLSHSTGSLDSTKGGKKSNKKTSETSEKNSTMPTIVAMVPKNKSGSPVVGLRLSRENTRSHLKPTPPETPPKPRKKVPIDGLTSCSAENISPLVQLSQGKGWNQSKEGDILNERPKSWAGVESLEIRDMQVRQDSPLGNLSSPLHEEREDAVDTEFSLEENEVFLRCSSVNGDEIQQQDSEEKVEVRPRAGVLKNSRDRSRDSRRSLRVSWGDLPERVDSPAPSVEYDDEEQQEEEEEQLCREVQSDDCEEIKEEDQENETDEAPRVTQL